MSFSGEVKEELLAQHDAARHCQVAELAAMISGTGRIHRDADGLHVKLLTENEQVAEKYMRLLLAVGDIRSVMTRAHHAQQKNKTSFVVDIASQDDVKKLLLVLKIIGNDGSIRENLTLTDGRLLQKNCCKRAFLRGAYLVSGSMSDPKKSYHFELVCADKHKAQQLQQLFASFELDARTICRKNHEIVYLKEGAQIVDALNIMGAHVALMDLENVRILKEMRNDINRRVNCETANINKTVNAAFRQQEAIRYLQEKGAFSELSEQLQEIAALRMEYPEATIQELGALCHPSVGKSGVNHRLRRLEELAERLGYQKKE